jgi:hypothetical protein
VGGKPGDCDTTSGHALVVNIVGSGFKADLETGYIPDSGAFSLAKRGPRGELAAIRDDFDILSLT